MNFNCLYAAIRMVFLLALAQLALDSHFHVKKKHSIIFMNCMVIKILIYPACLNSLLLFIVSITLCLLLVSAHLC